MATILEPSPTSNRAVAVRTSQVVRLRADTAWNWFIRTNAGAWVQFATGVLEVFRPMLATVTNRVTFDLVEIAIGSGATPDTSTTRHFDLCEGPPAVLYASASVGTDGLSGPSARPWDGEDDDPGLATTLASPMGAARGGLGTELLETASGGGPSTLVASWSSGVFVDTAGAIGVRTPFMSDARGLGPFPAIAAWYHGGLYFEHDFGKSRNLALTRQLYSDGNHIAVVRGDGRRNTYRFDGSGNYTAAAGVHNTLVKTGSIFTETTPAGRVYHYDLTRLTRVVDRCGNTAYYSYDVNSRLQRIDGLPGAGAVGLVPYLSYNASGLLEKLRLEDAGNPSNTRETYFTYDANENLLRIVGPEGCVTYFEYNPATRIQAVTDPEGYRWYFAFDKGRVARVIDARGATTYFSWTTTAALGAKVDRSRTITYYQWGAFGSPERVYNLGTSADYYHYDGDGNLVRSTTRLNRDWYYEYDARANRVAVNDPLLGRTYLAYDAQDLLRTFVDPVGRPTYFVYDGSRNLTQRTDALFNTTTHAYEATGLLRETTDRRGARTYLLWDTRGNVTQVTDPLQNTTYFAYNTANERTVQVDPLGRVSYMSYDKRGRVSLVLDPLGAPSYMHYDARCNLVLTRDARMNATTTSFDGNSNPYYRLDALLNLTYFQYDGEERLALQRNARGFATTWTYDELGRRQTQVDALGGVVYTAYDAAHQVERQVDPNGNATYLEYDPLGRMNRRKDALFNVAYTGYDAASQRVVTIDARSNPTYFEYDPRGWQRQTKDAIGAISYTTFDEEGNRLRSIDPLGQTTYFTHDLAGRLQTAKDQQAGVTYQAYDAASQSIFGVDELGATTYTTYDQAGRTRTTLDPGGLLTYHQYDLVGNLISRSLDQGWGNAPWGSSPWGGERATTYFVYDALNRRTRSVDPYSNHAYTAYDAVSNVERQINERGFATYFTYDALDRRTHTKDPLHFAVTYTGYDAGSRVVLQADQLGASTYLTYDRLNRTYFTHDPADLRTYLYYDAVGNRVEQRQSVSGVLRQTTWQHDRLNRVHTQVAADGGSSYMGYDLASNQVLTVDPVGRPAYVAYDTLNRTRARYNAFLEKSYLEYDARSSVVKQIDPMGRTTYMGYDPARRLRAQSNALGEFSYFFHDARGQRTMAINPRNYSTYLRYDLLGRQTHQTDALGGVAYMAYDEVGNRTLVLDPKGQGTYLTFDRLNRISHSKDQAAGITYMGYDARSSVVLRVDAGGRATYMGYDNAGRVERRYFANPVAGESADVPSYYRYDEVSNVILVDDRLSPGLAVSYYDHDKMDRVTKKFTGQAGAVYYEYDLSGMKQVLRDPEQTRSYYVYDAAGRLTAVEIAGARTAYFHYDQSGLPSKKLLPDNRIMSYFTYDNAGRLALQVNRHPFGIMNYFAYNRNAKGEATWIRRESNENHYFEFDALDRLTLEDQKSNSASLYGFRYAYDAASNRTNKSRFAPTSEETYYTYNNLNLLTQAQVLTGATTVFAHDSAQRMTSMRTAGEQSAYFAHDQRDQIARVTFARASNPDNTQVFGYTGLDERTVVADNAAFPAYFAYDDGKLLTVRKPSGFFNESYRHNLSVLDALGFGTLLDFTMFGGLNVASMDQIGTVWKAGEAGDPEVEDKYRTDSFGNTLVATAPFGLLAYRLRFWTPGLIRMNMVNDEFSVTKEKLISLMRHGAKTAPTGEPVGHEPCGGKKPQPGTRISKQVTPCPYAAADLIGEGRGTMVIHAGGNHGQTQWQTPVTIWFFPRPKMKECCTEIRFMQIVNGSVEDDWFHDLFVTKLGWNLDVNFDAPADPTLSYYPPPYYPWQTPWKGQRGRAELKDAPQLKPSFAAGDAWLGQQRFESCAVCISTVPGASAELANRLSGSILGCISWGHTIAARGVIQRQLGRIQAPVGRTVEPLVWSEEASMPFGLVVYRNAQVLGGGVQERPWQDDFFRPSP